MADRSTILSADAEEKLLQPIEEYVGKIQAQSQVLQDVPQNPEILYHKSFSPGSEILPDERRGGSVVTHGADCY